MRVALKAQNQCRMTLETLATVTNPRVVYAKQANIANGPQQVNNGNTTECAARAGQVVTAPMVANCGLAWPAWPFAPVSSRSPL
jgi:hypothetical protein